MNYVVKKVQNIRHKIVHRRRYAELYELYDAAGEPSTDKLKQLLAAMSSNEERIKKAMWMIDTSKGSSTVLLMAALNSASHAEVILNSVDISSETAFNLIKRSPEVPSWTILHQPHYFLREGRKDNGKAMMILISLIRCRVSYNQWLQLMTQTDTIKRTLLFWSMFAGLTDLAMVIMKTLQPKDRLHLLKIKEYYIDYTPVDWLMKQSVFLSEIKFLHTVELMLSNNDEDYKIFQPSFRRFCRGYDTDSNTRRLMYSPSLINRGCSLIELLLEKFSGTCQLMLVEESDGLESEVRDVMDSKGINLEPILKLLQKYRISAKTNMALSSRANEARINGIIELEPLTVQQIEELSPYSSVYLVPYDQSKSKKYAIILYASIERQGGRDEAENMQKALRKAGFVVLTAVWSHTREVLEKLSQLFTDIQGTCSLLQVCLMSHGYRGTLTGRDESQLRINDILGLLFTMLPDHLPLILLIQTCQGDLGTGIHDRMKDAAQSNMPSIDARRGADPRETAIELRRPHTLLLVATLAGGTAERGLFTGAIAESLNNKARATDIYAIYREAVKIMARSELGQTPILMSTLTKDLILFCDECSFL